MMRNRQNDSLDTRFAGTDPSGFGRNTQESRKQRRLKQIAFWVLCAAVAVEGGDITLFGASFEAFQEDLGFSPFILGMLSSTAKMVCAIMGVFWGWYVITHSRKKLLAGGVFCWGCISILMAFSSSLPVWFVLRALHGVSFACVGPIVHSIVADMTQVHERGRYYAAVAFAYHIG